MTRSILKNRTSNLDSEKDFFELFEEGEKGQNSDPVHEKGAVKKEKYQESYTRHTFLITEAQLNKLKNYVHTVRKNKDYQYTQKQALAEALNLLFQSIDNIEIRPSELP